MSRQMHDARPELSIIVPALNEAAGIVGALAALAPLRRRGAEVIVVDGGSGDATAALAAPLADRVLAAPRGRARQMNAGAAVARGRILLFLHADTRLPEEADRLVCAALDGIGGGRAGERIWGRFDVRIEGRSRWLPLVAAAMNLRSRLTGIATGDQALFVARAAFNAVGGYRDIPLMEDIALSAALRDLGRPACLRRAPPPPAGAGKGTASGARFFSCGGCACAFSSAPIRGAWPWNTAMPPVKTESPPRVGVAILARAPIPGQAKTRLIPALGAEGAARLQSWLLQRAVAMALVADVGPVTLWCAGDPRHPDFALCRAFGSVAVRHQPEGDLGARMRMALREAASPDGTLIVGTDCPALTAAHLRQAARALRERDAVVLPAEDGGYVLIGLREAAAEAFARIDWGTERVMAQTRARLRALGCQLGRARHAVGRRPAGRPRAPAGDGPGGARHRRRDAGE
jgi:rSAM/selenodomain-associated transferase 2/rSAM/selenodomain-associated transferase 1